MELREYQKDCLYRIKMALFEKERIIFQLPTGGGKSLIFSELCKDAIAKGTSVLILTESRKLFKQIQKDIPNAIEIMAGSKIKEIDTQWPIIAMAQSLIRREHLIQQLDCLDKKLLVIADEIHISTPMSVIRQLPGAYHLGVTATPNGTEAPHLKEWYRDIVCGPSTGKLIELGFLSPYRHFMRDLVDLSKLKVKAGEFDEESQFHAFQAAEVDAQLFKDLAEIPYKKCIIFCSSITAANTLSAKLKAQDYNCVAIHSESNCNIEEFTKGNTNICVSVGMLTKGFDYPPIDLGIFFRATKSLSLYNQMAGRCSRIWKDKDNFIILDYGGNGKRHGLWSADVPWHEKWNKEKKAKDDEGVAPMKSCPECFYLLPASAKECPECGYEYPDVKRKPTGEIIGYELIYKPNMFAGRWLSSLSAKELVLYGESKGVLKGLWNLAVVNDGRQPGYLKEFAEAAGYSPKWPFVARKKFADTGNFIDKLL